MIKILDKNHAKLIVSITTDGKRRRPSKVVEFTGKRDLQRKYEEFEREVKETPPTEMTVVELVDMYISKCVLSGARPTTERGYRTCEKRIQTVLNKTLAKSLTTYRLEKIIALWLSEHGYSPKTIHNTISLLSASYEYAIKIGVLDKNPCRNVTLPKQTQKEKVILSEEDMMKFLDALEEERLDYKVGYKLCLMCGLRRSEVLGLRESDVDIKQCYVNISKGRHRIGSEDKVTGTKTDRSTRVLAIPKSLAEDIAELIEEHHSFPYEKTDYLIQNGFGQMMNPSTFTNRIYRIEERAGLPAISPHGLRHTFASMLNASGVDIARISAELGHSNVNTTLGIYTHVFGNTTASSRDIAEKVEEKVQKKSGTFRALSKKKKPSKR